MNLLHIALAYNQRQFNVLPLQEKSKKPAVDGWKHWQERTQTEDDIRTLFEDHLGNIAIVCGSVSGNLAVLDVEDHDLYQELKAKFVAEYGATLLARTFRGGHIYFRTSLALATTKHEGFEIRSQGSYVAAHPSVHPQGVIYEWEGETHIVAAVPDWERFSICELKPASAPTQSNGRPRSVNQKQPAGEPATASISSERARAIIERSHHKNQRGNYASLSEFDQSIITSLTNGGASFEGVRQALLTCQHPTHYRRLAEEKGLQEAESNLRRSYEKAQGLGDRPELARLNERVASIREWAESNFSTGRTTFVDKDVFLAHIRQCLKAKQEPWFLSSRNGAEMAQVSAATFTRATKRLIAQKLLQSSGRQKKEHATHYSFGSFFSNLQIDTPPHGSEVAPLCVILEKSHSLNSLLQKQIEHLGSRGLLGKASVAVWKWLCSHKDSEHKKWRTQTITKETGLSYSTVKRALDKLIKAGWVAQENKFYWAREDAVNYVVDTYESSGASEYIQQKQQRHQREQEEFQSRLHHQRVSETTGGSVR